MRGVVKHLKKHTNTIQGVDLAISGDVPQGAGLSSSASLEVAVAKMFQVLYDRSEERRVGKECRCRWPPYR